MPGITSTFQAVLLLASVCFATMPAIASANNENARINKIKAAIVLNIARFVSWPDEAFDVANNRLTLCYYRSNAFGKALDGIKGETVSGRQLNIVQINNPPDAKQCQILLIPQPELPGFSHDTQRELTYALLTIADKTETVSSEKSIASNGILLNLVRKGSRIGFEIDLSKSKKAGLKMRSELLKHADIIGEDS